jgi:hypothetical protein
MTVKHIAWLKFKSDISEERINHHMDACRALVGKVPTLISLECGADFMGRSGGFTHGIIVTVPSRESLPEYLNHPEHIPVAAALKADLEDLRVMDIEI